MLEEENKNILASHAFKTQALPDVLSKGPLDRGAFWCLDQNCCECCIFSGFSIVI